MGFLHPAMLWWLFAALIPVVIHLFNFRRHKTLLFSNIELLKNLQEQTNKTNQLKHLVVLSARILAIVSLVMVFAQPFLKNTSSELRSGKKIVSVYLDNSLSMQRRVNATTYFESAQQKAKEIVSGFDLNTSFVLLTNDFHPRHNRMLTRNEFMQEIEALQPAAASADLGNVIKRALITTKNDPEADKYLFLLTDFQESATKWDNLPSDSSLRVFLVPSTGSADENVFIDSLWINDVLLQKDKEAVFSVRIVNDGNNDLKGIPVKLEIGGRLMSITNVDIQAKSTETIELQFLVPENGFHQGVVSLQDYPVVFDDELYFSFNAIPTIKVLEIYESPPDPGLKLLFEDRTDVEFVSSPQLRLDVQSLSSYQLVIINQLSSFSTGMQLAVEQFLQAGGSVALIPGEQSALAYNGLSQNFGLLFGNADTTKTRVFAIADQHPFFKNVFVKIPDNADLPIVMKHLLIEETPGSQAFQLMKLVSGNVFIALSETRGGGKLYVFASSLSPDWSNLTRNQLFVPLIYRMLFRSPSLQPLYEIQNEKASVQLKLKAAAEGDRLRVRDAAGQIEIIPAIDQGMGGSKLIVSQLPAISTHYLVSKADAVVEVFSVNMSRTESYLKSIEAGSLKKAFIAKGFRQVEMLAGDTGSVGNEMAELLNGKNTVWIFVLLVLGWLLIEGILLRYWK
ncbi:MAG TPA: BatA domain-containing protein [Bacteroidales bacterium]|mgnify:FL=1|nr:BatA domain-containing protein [Bacteroidales bacterium]